MPNPLRLTDTFGHLIPVKKLLISLIGLFTYPRLRWINDTTVTGAEKLARLPETNVLFVSNHQTYFADVITMIHVFAGVKRDVDPILPPTQSFLKRIRNPIRNPFYLLNPRVNVYFIAAEETMKSGWLPRLFAYVGSVSVKRTWREAGKDIHREVDPNDTRHIRDALGDGWVITFPQGTTRAYAPGRKGTAHIIKNYRPVVVPIVIDGFRRAFDKRGLFLKKRGVKLSVRFKDPLDIRYDDDVESILHQVMQAIEQSEAFHFRSVPHAEDDPK